MFSRSEKYITEQRENWQHTDRQDRAGYFCYEIGMGIPSKNNIRKSLGIIRLLFENYTPPPHVRPNTHKQRERDRDGIYAFILYDKLFNSEDRLP